MDDTCCIFFSIYSQLHCQQSEFMKLMFRTGMETDCLSDSALNPQWSVLSLCDDDPSPRTLAPGNHAVAGMRGPPHWTQKQSHFKMKEQTR